jgi:hypothetical protein
MMKKSKFTTWLSAFLICCLSVSFLGVSSVILPVSMVSVPAVYAYPNVSGNVTAALGYLDSIQANDGSIGTFANSVWAVMAIVAAGEDPDAGRWANATGYSLVDYLIDNQNQIDVSKATDVERFILAMESAGVDSSNMGGTNYVNILMNLNDTYDAGKYQIGDNTTLNDDFWGIMALVSAGVSTDNWLIQDSTEFIKANQRVDDGWSWTTNMTYGSDVDDTAAGIIALVAAGEGSSSNVADAVAYLKSEQDPATGGFEYDDGVWPSSGVNSDSDSWAISAIYSVGESPFQCPLNGTDVVDNLLTLQDGATGRFNWTASNPGWDQVMPTINAILGLCFPNFLNITININITINLFGDFNGNDALDNSGLFNDQFLLQLAILASGPVDPFDLNNDGAVNATDMDLWNIMKTDYDT